MTEPESPASPSGENPDKEARLFVFVDTLVRHRNWLVGTLLAVVASAAGYVALQPAVYEARSVIEIGAIDGKAMESPAAIHARLAGQFPKSPSATQPAFVKAEGEEGIVTLTTRGLSSRSARQFLQGRVDSLLTRHHRQLADFQERRQSRIEALTNQIESLRALQGSMSDAASQGKSGILTAGDFLLLEQQLFSRLPSLEQRRADLLEQLAESRTHRTRVLVAPTTESLAGASGPVEPRPRLVMALATVLGLLLGVFVVFGRVFVQRYRAAAHGVA